MVGSADWAHAPDTIFRRRRKKWLPSLGFAGFMFVLFWWMGFIPKAGDRSFELQVMRAQNMVITDPGPGTVVFEVVNGKPRLLEPRKDRYHPTKGAPFYVWHKSCRPLASPRISYGTVWISRGGFDGPGAEPMRKAAGDDPAVLAKFEAVERGP